MVHITGFLDCKREALFVWCLFLNGIGYWNSMGYLTAETQRKLKRKNLFDSLRLCGSIILTTEDTESTEKKAAVKNP
jgi:hypothetical protein